jgi:hypothetical protein
MSAFGELERIREEQLWPTSRYYLGICLEGLRKTMKTLSEDLYQVPLEYKSEVLLLQATCLVERIYDTHFPSNASVSKNYKLTILQFSDPFLCIYSISTDFNHVKYVRYNLNVPSCL